MVTLSTQQSARAHQLEDAHHAMPSETCVAAACSDLFAGGTVTKPPLPSVHWLGWSCKVGDIGQSYPSEGRYLKKDIERNIEDGYILRYTLYWRNK